MKVGINGFGRIGKNIYKILIKNGIEVPLINDPFIDLEYLAYLIKYDSVYGSMKDVKIEKDHIIVEGIVTYLSREKMPEEIPWAKYGTEIVIESSGVFLTEKECSRHNAKRIILTAPSSDIPMFVYGVNHTDIGNERVISAASCTTNCLAPLAKLLNDEYGIEEGLMTTVHSITSTQKTTDSKGGKVRSARSCMNIIPASTGAAKAVGKVLPELEGKLNGMAFRVPVPNVSVVDLVVKLKKPTDLSKIKKAIENSKEKMRGTLGVTEELIVSSDMIGETRSSVVDLSASMELSPHFFKIISWYDNEHGYSCRVVDLLLYMYYKS